MIKKDRKKYIGLFGAFLIIEACGIPKLVNQPNEASLPNLYNAQQSQTDTLNSTLSTWKEFFPDVYLQNLIDTALKNNQELNIILQEIEVSKNEIKARKGEYLPFVGLKAGAGLDKVGRYTSKGASEAVSEITPGKEIPEPLPDYLLGLQASWEVDIWHKLRNAKKSAIAKYLSSVEGKKFMQTKLIAEVANSYYELLALDNQLSIIKKNIEIQSNALETIKLQKEAAKVTELAVKRFEAQLYNTQKMQYQIQQQVVETENRINFLLGRYPQNIQRHSVSFLTIQPSIISTGLPIQLLQNRADVKQAEYDLAASKLDVQSAKAGFYPSLGLSAVLGYQAFKPSYLLKTPESLLYGLAGDITAPLINRNVIKANYVNANAKQIQAVYNYQSKVLNAYLEVQNQMSKINNLDKSYQLVSKQVDALGQSVEISNNLFSSARADYMEVLLTQREALESKFELIETQKARMMTLTDIYQALGGGWR